MPAIAGLLPRSVLGGRRRRGRAPGFSLIEILVVIALLAAVAAVVISVGAWRIGQAALTESVAQIESALVSARAHAQRDGVVVLIIAQTDDDGASRLLAEVQNAPADEGVSGSTAPEPAKSATLIDLPLGVRFEAMPDTEADAAELPPAAERPLAFTAPLALCLPDGRVEPSQPLPILAGEQGSLTLTIQRWSGAVTAAAIRDQTDEVEEPDAPADDSEPTPDATATREPAAP